MDNLREFLAASQRIREAVPLIHAESLRRLVLAGFQFLAESSPVLNGYYRAGHTIGFGLDRPSGFLFEHPERVGEDGPYPRRQSPIPGPDLATAEASLAAIGHAAQVVFHNDVRHASYVEEGTASMPPRLIYQRSQQHVEAQIESEAARVAQALAEIER